MNEEKPKQPSKKSLIWESVRGATGLKRYIPAGTYYVQAKLQGRRVRESLGTDNLQTARTKLASWIALHRTNGSGAGTGAVMGALIELWLLALQSDNTITDSTRDYKKEVLDYILKNWPNIRQVKVRKIKKHDVESWKRRQGCGPTRVNGALTVLRELFDLADARGVLRGVSPLRGVKNLPVGIKPFTLPTKDQMVAIRGSVYDSSPEAGLLFDLLAETGSRISTATAIRWEHINWDRNVIYYERVKWKEHGYEGPMSKKLREVLEKSKPERANGPIVSIGSIRKPLETACKRVGITPQISHHDLRHWFVTRCIEKKVDIPTISRWVGHVDGGALLMQTYGHLRDEHSQEMAKLL
jgi:integrase